MKIHRIHGWGLSPVEAVALQRTLATRVVRKSALKEVHLIAGVDLSPEDPVTGAARAAIVLLSYPDMRVEEIATAEAKPPFPYVPGLLSFREAPIILQAAEKLSRTPDLLLVDGQGIAHPRRLGIASHLGLFLDIPTIGCAKSRLAGRHEPPGAEVGDYAELRDRGEVIGVALRTRRRSNPLYVSIGHKVSLDDAITWTLATSSGYKVPEPTRLAHYAAAGQL